MKTKNLYLVLLIVILLSISLSSCKTVDPLENIDALKAEINKYDNPDGNRDTWNLRHDADFEVKVADDVYWVPANTLGKSRYTNYQITMLVNQKPEVKQAMINNLHEALQLYQISNFQSDDDNIKIRESSVSWEFHQPGYHAVRTNSGCCAANTSWLRYILQDDFEEVGILQISDLDGNGHVIDYIRHDDWYYFIDLTHYREDMKRSSAIENGTKTSYRNSDVALGNIHKCKDPKSYVKYFRSVANNPPAFFAIYQASDCCIPIGLISKTSNSANMVYPVTAKKTVTVLYDDPKDGFKMSFTGIPPLKPNWYLRPTAKFKIDEQYLVPDIKPTE